MLHLYPSADTLPENLLRFYIHFSKPMKAVNNLENIKLLNEDGLEIRGAIFNNVYELWDVEQKQLTLILDPARVKTGLIVHETMGRVLKIGKRFQLVIETAEDIYGQPMERTFVKEFFVSEPDRIMPDIQNWQIIEPDAGSKSSLQLVFSHALDLSLIHI